MRPRPVRGAEAQPRCGTLDKIKHLCAQVLGCLQVADALKERLLLSWLAHAVRLVRSPCEHRNLSQSSCPAVRPA